MIFTQKKTFYLYIERKAMTKTGSIKNSQRVGEGEIPIKF